MRAKFLQEVIDETPKDVEIFMRWYADLTVRINRVLKEKGISQKELAESLGKKPSEISKWLTGEHNFTLRSLAKLQADLDVELIQIPFAHSQNNRIHGEFKMTVSRNTQIVDFKKFEKFDYKQNTNKHIRVAS